MNELLQLSQQIDSSWLTVIHSYTSPALDWAAWLLSSGAWLGACWWALCIVLWVRGYRLLAAQMVIAMLFAAVGAEGLKLMSHRLRPSDLMPQYVHLPLPNLPDSRWAFPSGHVALSAAAVMTAFFSPYKKLAWMLVPVVIAIGWARIYQGVHWPSDVVARLVIGILAASLAAIVSKGLARQSFFSDAGSPRPVAQQRSGSTT